MTCVAMSVTLILKLTELNNDRWPVSVVVIDDVNVPVRPTRKLVIRSIIPFDCKDFVTSVCISM